MRNWLLPENIADILPTAARQVETAKADILSLFRTYGYEFVLPPMMEYIESLMANDDPGLLLKTFRMVDQLSGRQLGIRADITPQVARIDAHLLGNRKGVNRLCYAGSVLRAKPDGLMSSREPLQIGAELYGYVGLEADLEIIELMLLTLRLLNVSHIRLNLGHIAIFRALVAEARLSTFLGNEILTLLQIKDCSSLVALLNDEQVAEPWHSAFLALPTLYGSDESVLERAEEKLPGLPLIIQALSQLRSIYEKLKDIVPMSFDLAELRGDSYHTGLLFAAYAPGWSHALAQGGRYDNMGASFGRARPATGFSFDLRDLMRVLPQQITAAGIRVDHQYWPAAADAIRKLREQGEIVIVDYAGESPSVLNCNRELIPSESSGWITIVV